MNPTEFTQKQVDRYRQMTGEQRLMIALNLHEMSCEIARDGIRGRFPNATPEMVETKLRERLRLITTRNVCEGAAEYSARPRLRVGLGKSQPDA